MKIGVLESWWDGEPIASGLTSSDVIGFLEAARFDAVQIGGRWSAAERTHFVRQLSGRDLRLLEWGHEADLLADDSDERTAAFERFSAGLREAASLGAVHTVLVPSRRSASDLGVKLFGADRGEAVAVLEERLIDVLCRLALTAEDLGAVVMIEPLNRYESGIFHRVGDVARVCRAVGSPSVRLMADLFHMSIEEVDLSAALRSVADVLGHVQLADTNRFQPGAGHLHFPDIMDALVGTGFDGWMSYECKFTEDTDAPDLASSAAWLRIEWESARARQLPGEGVVEQR